MAKLFLSEEATPPGTPAAGTVVIYPKTDGKMYSKDDLGAELLLSSVGGDVVGPASASDGAVAVFNGTTGKLVKNSTLFQDGSGNVGVGVASPKSLLDVNGSFGAKVVNKTAGYTAAEETTILVDASGANVVIALPAAAAKTGRIYVVKKTDASANSVTIDPNGAELIDGLSTLVMVIEHDGVLIQSDGVGWRVLAETSNTEPYAQLSSTVNQQPGVTTPTEVTFNSNDEIEGVTHSTSSNTEDIIIRKPGHYFILAAAQVGKTSGSSNVNIDLWMRKNGADIPNSNTRAGIVVSTDTVVLVAQLVTHLVAGDVVNIMQSVSSTSVGAGLIATAPAGEPVIPSIIFTLYRI